MKFLKGLLYFVLALVVLVGVGSLFLPSQVHVERSKVIDAPISTVYNVVLDLHTWSGWDRWSQMDSNMVVSFEGEPNQVGMVRKWTSDVVGEGSMTITDMEAGSEIEHALDFGENGKANSSFVFEDADGGTKVTWGFDVDLGMNPIYKYLGLLMEDQVGKDFETGLDNLEAFVQNLPKPDPSLGGMEFSTTDMPAMTLLSVKAADVPLDDISKVSDELYGKLYAYAGEQNIEAKGAPSSIWYEYDEEGSKATFAACISVAEGTTGGGEFKMIELEPFYGLVYNYTGSYEDMGEAYELIMQYIDAKGFTMVGPSMEIYEVGPVDQVEPSKWITKIVFPIEKPVQVEATEEEAES